MELDEGLLFILGRAPAGAVTAYNEWYDEDHVPPRMSVPGITGACRYSDAGIDNAMLAAADAGTTGLGSGADPDFDPALFLSYYDLRTLDVLDGDGYRSLGAGATDRERAMQKVCSFDRRVYRSIPVPAGIDAQDPTSPGQFLVCAWWSPAEGNGEQDEDWVNTEYLPRLLRIPGWLRARHFELVSGPGPEHLALFDVDSLEAFTDGSYDAVLQTALGSAVIHDRTASAVRLLRLHRRFEAVGAA